MMQLDNEEYHRGRRLDQLMSAVIIRRQTLVNPNARRHIFEGFLRRLAMIEASWVHLRELHHRDKPGPLSPYEANDTGIHVNAYYLNVCGALDNLAWSLQYEREVLTGIDEQHPNRVRVVLFGDRFLTGLKQTAPSLVNDLSAYAEWHGNLRTLRDPAAHRVPIYVPPGILDESTADTVKRMHDESDTAARTGSLDRALELQREAYALGKFTPVMILSSPEGLEVRSISKQVTSDQTSFLTVCEATLGTLLPEPS